MWYGMLGKTICGELQPALSFHIKLAGIGEGGCVIVNTVFRLVRETRC